MRSSKRWLFRPAPALYKGILNSFAEQKHPGVSFYPHMLFALTSKRSPCKDSFTYEIEGKTDQAFLERMGNLDHRRREK
jgi:hypothetical protein